MTKHLEPPFESNKRKVRPKDGKKTINEEDREPLIVPDNFRKTGLPLVKDINARCNQCKVHARVERAPLFERNSAYLETENVKPFRNLPGGNDQEPDERDPKRTGYIGSFPDVSPVEEDNKADRKAARYDGREVHGRSINSLQSYSVKPSKHQSVKAESYKASES